MIAKVPTSRQVDTGQVDEEHPWPGLAAFREEDRLFFHGRDREAGDLCRLVLRNRLTLLYGLSGLGKTSLLRAGLFPRLRDAGVFPVYIRLHYTAESPDPFMQAKETILKAVTDARIESPLTRPEETLWEYFHRRDAEFWGPRHRLLTPLLVFDQFEEIFTLGKIRESRTNRAKSFMYEIMDLAQGSIPDRVRERLEAAPEAARELSFTRHNYKILLSLREDYLPDLQDQGEAVSSLLRNYLRLHRMNGDQAFEVVTKAGRDLISAEVARQVAHVVAKAKEEAPLSELEVDPALLSVFCRELNNKRIEKGQSSITAPLLKGHQAAILADFYERSLTDIPQSVRDFIEKRLVNSAGQREILTLDTVLETVPQETVEELVDRRLLRIEERAGIQRVELIHDLLTDVIRQSREDAARREAELKLRRSLLALALLALVLLGVVTLAVWGFAAQKKASTALASSYRVRAANLQDSNPAQALAYLAQAIREEPESIPAQGLLTDLILYRSWPRPIAELRVGDAEWVQLSDDGHLFVAVSEGGGRLRIWDTQTLQKVGEVKQALAIKSIEISRDGRRLLIVSPGVAYLWDTQTSTSLWHVDLEKGEVLPRFSPDGRWLAWIRDRRTTLVLRDNNMHREREIIKGAELGEFGFSPDSRKIFAARNIGGQVFLWDVESGRSLPAPYVHDRISNGVFSPESRHLLVTGYYFSLSGFYKSPPILWDLDEKTEKQVGDTAGRGWLDPGGERAATYDSGELRVWNTRTYSTDSPEPLRSIPKRDLYEAEFSRDGRRLLTTSEEGVELWDIDTGRMVSAALCECLHGRFLAGTPQIVTGDDTGVLRVWSPEPVQTATDLYRASGSTVIPSSFSQDGSRLAIQTADDKIHLWDMDAVRLLGAPIGPVMPPWFELSPDGRFLYETREDALRIWDTRAGRPAWPFLRLPKARRARSHPVNLANEVVGVQSEEDTVQLWSLATGGQLGAVRQDQEITNFDFTPGGDLVTTSANNVFTWDSRTGKSLRSAFAHESPVTSFDFSPDGKLIATGTEYGLVRIWDLRTGQMLVGPLRHRDEIDSVLFQLKGRILLTSARNLLRLWDTRTGQPKSANLRAQGVIRSAQLGAYGTRILVNSMDRETDPSRETVRLLDAQTGQRLVEISVKSYADAHLSSTGQILWVVSPDYVHVFVVPHFPEQDRELLARWAEAVGGWAVDDDGNLVELSDQLARLETLRRETADAPPGQLRAASLIRWFLSNPKTRPVSPVFERTLSND